MLPEFVAERSLYHSQAIYVNASGVTSSGAGDIVPAASNFCMTQGGSTRCTVVTGTQEGVLWGFLIGAIGGPVGALIGGILGGVYCLIFGCD